ncbi:hypothetical protein P170DRAFT_382888 [Aspergillus steynii IBT 23096]|uniref:Rhodopsin domain-containing protein n=1 Tax=Aspergillus steynii IBT 23096 TaxID=1392250 RepID=A0A2I2G6W0_9EURO|nr:uncharacterized protein P170DRAFT_382888 [Aspergillus steynii IBT 23096]PLB48610.1 hypothetical protein P170DRAFT_382888 [Aspergillus steynii IBT 23096]
MVSGRSEAILVTTAVILGISQFTVFLRFYVRLRLVRSFGTDDWIMLIASIFNIGFGICGILGAVYGMGQKTPYFANRPDHYRWAMLCFYFGQVFYVVTCVLARLSIALSLLRLTVERIHSLMLYIITALSIMAGLIFFFFTVFQCQPVHYFWNRIDTPGRCLNMDLLLGIVYMYSAVAAICDFTIGLLPAFMVWKLKMNQRTKVAVAGLLGIGCVASSAVIVRMPFLQFSKHPEFLYQTTQIAIWSHVEAGLGLTAASLMTIRPLLRAMHVSSPRSSG